MAAPLQLFLFGSLQALYWGRRLELKFPPKAVPLWAYLLLRQEQAVTRSFLAFSLWPDVPEEVARANLRRHLHHLKSALPPSPDALPWLLIDAHTARWNPASPYWLDVAEFERQSQGDTAAREKAIALYRGDFLADCYDDLIFPERERLRQLYLSNLSSLIHAYRSQRCYDQAMVFATRLLAVDPLREDTVRLLMALHYESGDRAGAMKEYVAFRQRLQEEMEIAPMPETQALAEAIRRDRLPSPGDMGGRHRQEQKEGEALFPARRRPLALPFVGRGAELGRLDGWWRQAASGSGTLVMVSGEAGVGKTRLVEEFSHQVEAQGGRVLLGHALASGETPYRSLVEALRHALPLVAALDLPPFWLAVLARLLPELRGRRGRHAPPLPPLPALDPEQERLRLFEALFLCLAGLSKPRPVALILEDLHWAGAGTADLLAFVARRLASHPLLVVGTCRQEELTTGHPLATTRRALQRDGLWQPLPLGSLPRQAVAQLLHSLAGDTAEATDLAGRLFAASEGHPLFLHELLRDLIDKGVVRPQSGQWQLRPMAELDVAPGVRQAITARLARLSPPALTLAEVAAVLGQAFPFDLLHQASGWAEREVLARLDELLDGQVIREAGQGRAFDYAFSHHLVQAALYEASSPAQRQRRHRRLAGLLAARQETPGEIARHYDLGGEPEQAATFYLQAARQALHLRADDEALQALARALALAQAEALRYQLLCEQEDIWHRRGERAQQADCLCALEAVAARLGDGESGYQVLRRRVRYYRALGERQLEGETVQALKRRAAASHNSLWQAEAYLAEAGYLILTGRYAEASAALQAARPLYEALGNISGQVACRCQLAEIAVHQSRFDLVRAHVQAAEALTQGQSDQALLVWTLRTASAAAFGHQDYGESRSLADQMLALCREIGDREGEADAQARLATVAARVFRVEDARRHYAQAGELYALLGKRQGQAAVQLNAGILAVNLGRYAEGIARFRQAEALFQAMDDLRGLAVSALNQSAAAIYLGDWQMALPAAQQAHDLALRLGMTFVQATALGNLGEIALNRGALVEAVGYLRRSLALRQEAKHGPGDSATDLSLLALALFRLGDKEAARQVARQLVTLCETFSDTIPYPQQALWAAAQVCRGLGEGERAAGLLAQAWSARQARAAAIPDPESLAGYQQIPYNRELELAWEKDIWPDLAAG